MKSQMLKSTATYSYLIAWNVEKKTIINLWIVLEIAVNFCTCIQLKWTKKSRSTNQLTAVAFNGFLERISIFFFNNLCRLIFHYTVLWIDEFLPLEWKQSNSSGLVGISIQNIFSSTLKKKPNAHQYLEIWLQFRTYISWKFSQIGMTLTPTKNNKRKRVEEKRCARTSLHL